MAFALVAKRIKCPNCGYEGVAKVKGAGGGSWIAILILFCASLLFWPLFIVFIIATFWNLLKPAEQICPRCKYANPIPE